MKKDKTPCDLEMLSRFSDHELESRENIRMSEHVGYCASCRHRLRDHEAISILFKRRLDRELLGCSLEPIEESVVALIERNNLPWWVKAGRLLVSRKFYVPATALAAALVLFFALSGPQGYGSGPSAVVSYLGGDIESVMILETQKSHRTVVWFNEIVTSGEEAAGVQGSRSTLRTLYTKRYLVS